MATLVEERSKITAKGQTTVPKAVRQALGVSYGGEIAFIIDEQGVRVRPVETEEADPVITAFLSFLEQDMTCNSHNIVSFPPGLAERIATLTQGNAVDSEEDIEGPVAL